MMDVMVARSHSKHGPDHIRRPSGVKRAGGGWRKRHMSRWHPPAWLR